MRGKFKVTRGVEVGAGDAGEGRRAFEAGQVVCAMGWGGRVVHGGDGRLGDSPEGALEEVWSAEAGESLDTPEADF
jgi:hypothetical protein